VKGAKEGKEEGKGKKRRGKGRKKRGKKEEKKEKRKGHIAGAHPGPGHVFICCYASFSYLSCNGACQSGGIPNRPMRPFENKTCAGAGVPALKKQSTSTSTNARLSHSPLL
jgi:hypothetical protein